MINGHQWSYCRDKYVLKLMYDDGKLLKCNYTPELYTDIAFFFFFLLWLNIHKICYFNLF